MAQFPDWILKHPTLKEWSNRVDWTAYAVAGDQAEETGDLDLADDIRWAGLLLQVFSQGTAAVPYGRGESVADGRIAGLFFIFRGRKRTVLVEFYPMWPERMFQKWILYRDCLANPRYLATRVLQEFIRKCGGK